MIGGRCVIVLFCVFWACREFTYWTLSWGLGFLRPLCTWAGSRRLCSHMELAPLLAKVWTIWNAHTHGSQWRKKITTITRIFWWVKAPCSPNTILMNLLLLEWPKSLELNINREITSFFYSINADGNPVGMDLHPQSWVRFLYQSSPSVVAFWASGTASALILPALPCSLLTLHFSALPAVVREAIRCASGAWLWRYGGLGCGGLNSIHHRSGPLGWYWSSPGLTGKEKQMDVIPSLRNELVCDGKTFQHCLKCFTTIVQAAWHSDSVFSIL